MLDNGQQKQFKNFEAPKISDDDGNPKPIVDLSKESISAKTHSDVANLLGTVELVTGGSNYLYASADVPTQKDPGKAQQPGKVVNPNVSQPGKIEPTDKAAPKVKDAPIGKDAVPGGVKPTMPLKEHDPTRRIPFLDPYPPRDLKGSTPVPPKVEIPAVPKSNLPPKPDVAPKSNLPPKPDVAPKSSLPPSSDVVPKIITLPKREVPKPPMAPGAVPLKPPAPNATPKPKLESPKTQPQKPKTAWDEINGIGKKPDGLPNTVWDETVPKTTAQKKTEAASPPKKQDVTKAVADGKLDAANPEKKEDDWTKWVGGAFGVAGGLTLLARALMRRRDAGDASNAKPEVKPEPSTKPVEVAAVNGKVLTPESELLIDEMGKPRSPTEAKPDAIMNLAGVRMDAEGKVHVRPLTNDVPIHVRTTNGDIKTIASAEVELKPGEMFSAGRAEFIPIQKGKLPTHDIRLTSNDGLDLPLNLKDGQIVEVGNSGKLIKADKGVDARVEIATPGVSAKQARFGIDSNGLFVVDGGLAPGSTEMMPSENGTFVNGKRLPAGEKVYLKPDDKITFGEGEKANEVKIEQRIVKVGDKAPSDMVPKREGNTLRSIEGKSMGEPFRFTIGNGRQITIGKEGHIDVGGAALAKNHAQIRVDNSGNTFMRVLSQGAGAPDASAYIERNGGSNVQVTPKDGWVPVGPKDSISMGGSKFFSLTERPGTPNAVQVRDEKIKLDAGDFVTFGREPGDGFSDGVKRIKLDATQLSRTHARIGVDEKGTMYIEDIGTDGKGSTNGTFVNGNRVAPGKRQPINEGDAIWLGSPHHPSSQRIDLVDVLSKGDKVLGDRILDPKPVERPVRIEPRADAVIRGVDIDAPVDLKGSIVVGEVNGKTIRIKGAVSEALPHESIGLSEVDVKALGTEKSQFEIVELNIRGEKVNYYRPKDNPNRFYVLGENGPNGPKLIRDYEVFVERSGGSPGGTPGAPGGKPGDSSGSGGPAKPSEGPKPDAVPPAKGPGGDGKPPASPDAAAGAKLEGGKAPGGPGVDELPIETSPFEKGKSGPGADRPVAAMESNKMIDIKLPGGLEARVPRAELPKFLDRAEKELRVEELGKIFDARAADESLPKEERAQWKHLSENFAKLSPEEKVELRTELFAKIRSDLAIAADTRGEAPGRGRSVMKTLGTGGAVLGVGILTGALLHHMLRSESKSTGGNRIQVQFKK